MPRTPPPSSTLSHSAHTARRVPGVGFGMGAMVLGAMTLQAGCASPTVGFESPSPLYRVKAIALAGESNNPDDLPALVRALSSEDPAERLFAIRSLEQRTGTTLGYNHAASPKDRTAAIARWREWLQTPNSPAPPEGEYPQGEHEVALP